MINHTAPFSNTNFISNIFIHRGEHLWNRLFSVLSHLYDFPPIFNTSRLNTDVFFFILYKKACCQLNSIILTTIIYLYIGKIKKTKCNNNLITLGVKSFDRFLNYSTRNFLHSTHNLLFLFFFLTLNCPRTAFNIISFDVCSTKITQSHWIICQHSCGKCL